jgi:hypothetical protein
LTVFTTAADGRFVPMPRFFNARRRALYVKALSHGLFAVAPVVLTAGILYLSQRGHSLGIDFKYSFWPGAHRLLNGSDVYQLPGSPAVAAGEAFDYPAVGAVLLAPFALLPHGVANLVFVAICLASVPLTLWILEVRDWRVYGVAMLWWPVISGWQVGNTTLLLGIGLALAWRFRDRPAAAGALATLLVSAKLFLWPLGLWLLATRRYASVAYAAGYALVFNVLAWAIVGFDELPHYERLAASAARVYERRGTGPLAWALAQGISPTAGWTVMLGITAVVAGACYAFGRRGDDRAAIAMAILAALLATPVIWMHYYALLIVPLAVARPRLAPIWGLPILLDGYAALSGKPTLQLALLALVVICLVGAAIRQPSRERARWSSPVLEDM